MHLVNIEYLIFCFIKLIYNIKYRIEVKTKNKVK